ncbi:NifB/NifX family molybdenum-iron cluster-binding protein [Opitutus sp. ER46]|uniref:NifB/NifX family molybdenum-iron cluster-binding protein n=1 Tax=Opitutus sp. ER46 TaxID=2161864 RepID=UPI001304ED65|nr:NifB/NifX family molybdenum-iron cluster-binding protein [Opitutus sp. ER46]
MQNPATPRRVVSRDATPTTNNEEAASVVIGLPLTATGDFSPHFGAAAQVGLFTVDTSQHRILAARTAVPPMPEPCGWADWLGRTGVKVFLAGGMGRGAQERMAAAGVAVITGVPVDTPALLAQAWLNGTLAAGPNGCEGAHGHHQHHDHGDHHHGCCGQ